MFGRMRVRKKLTVTVVGMVCVGVCLLLDIEPAALTKAIAGIGGIVATFNVGQGIADLGKEGR